jgi:hypothetical protein
MRLVRLLQGPVQEHPFIIAAKSAARRRARAIYRASISVGPLAALAAGKRASANVTVANTGTATWRAGAEAKTGHVRVGIQLLDASMGLVERDFARGGFAADLAPGGSATVEVPFAAPRNSGEYALKFDLVAEGLTWFEPVGSPVEVVRIRVV